MSDKEFRLRRARLLFRAMFPSGQTKNKKIKEEVGVSEMTKKKKKKTQKKINIKLGLTGRTPVVFGKRR
jgi:hypothetical protein